ncbi:prepilin peptidase [Zophobihabitans entericus]|uniref:Prepilin leader peptidase/N-methyltransferase n=1 Tax=Zophobihabitans entericus TaxID=1635327 RepID=A0A6G9IC76_9GAMM|nr:A24 family peptidase [Zophobihabitans entericus]QIQ21836.1 prepilin peptidase [Zophobihabitans entericus]
MNILIIALVGACVGSFLNVIVYRWQQASSVWHLLNLITFDRSRCPHCQIQLSVIDLIPVFSWLLLKGKCRSCFIKISSRYFVIEIITTTVFILLSNHFNTPLQIMLFCGLSCWFIVLALIDLDNYLLPDILTLPLLWFGLLCACWKITLLSLEQAFLGCIIGFLLLWIPANLYYLFTKKTGLGGGDIKLLSALGTWIPYTQLPYLLIIASLAGLGYSLYLYLIKKSLPRKIPFGPCLLLSGWLLMIYFSPN